MNRISRNLSIIYRTERLIARRQMAVLRQQTGLVVCAGLMAGLGIIMLNIAAFFALSDVMANHYAALVIAVVNLALAGVLVSYASRVSADTELAPATEVRDMAIAELEADIEQLADEARDLTHSVKKMARDPLGTALPALAGPLLTVLLKNTKK